jgi:hypothetical protein
MPPLPDRTQDWAWAQLQYETTGRSQVDIANDIGVSPTMLISKASRQGWTRRGEITVLNKVAEIAAEREEKVRLKQAQQLEVIERVNVEMQARKLMEHRKDIQRVRKLCMRLFDELEQATENVQPLSELGEMLRDENERGVDKLNDMYQQIISMPERSKTLKSLTEALKTMIALERQAFGIQGALEDPEKPSTPEQAVEGMDVILSKFATVLSRTAAQVAPKQMGPVVENQ